MSRKYTSILVGILCCVGVQNASADLSRPEKRAMKALYDCNKDSLKAVPGWYNAFDDNGPKIPVGSNQATNRKLHGKHEKVPEGIRLELQGVGGVNDGVVDFILPNKGLTCLPMELNEMIYLGELDLSNNEIRTNTLEMLNDLTTLISLDLSNNRKGNICDGSSGISGDIPSFSDPFFIEKINLRGNCLAGIIITEGLDLFKLGGGSLQYLDISDNMISGGLPDLFDFFKKIKKIDVSCNKFVGISGNIDYLSNTSLTAQNSFIMQRTGCPMKEQGNSFPKKVQKKARNGGNVFVYDAEPLGTANLKTNQFESKVSLTVRNIIARYIQRLEKKLKEKTKAQIIQVKKKESERIKTIAKKYQPLSNTDMNMLKYLFIEIENL